MPTRNCVVCRKPLPGRCSPARLYCSDECKAEAAPARKARAKKGSDGAERRRTDHDDKPPGERPTTGDGIESVMRPDEWRFCQAIEAERKRLRRRFLSWAEVWAVAMGVMREQREPEGANG